MLLCLNGKAARCEVHADHRGCGRCRHQQADAQASQAQGLGNVFFVLAGSSSKEERYRASVQCTVAGFSCFGTEKTDRISGCPCRTRPCAKGSARSPRNDARRSKPPCRNILASPATSVLTLGQPFRVSLPALSSFSAFCGADRSLGFRFLLRLPRCGCSHGASRFCRRAQCRGFSRLW